MFPSPDTSARATPSLQWVPWPPLTGALRFPTFIGTMGFYDRSRSIRHPSGRPLGSRTSPNEEEIGSSLRFLGHPCGACPGLETPASRPDLANSGRCRILPSACSDTSASQRWTICRVEETRCTLDFPWLCPPFPASCPFRSIMAHRGLPPHRPHRADFPQRVRQADSPPLLRCLLLVRGR